MIAALIVACGVLLVAVVVSVLFVVWSTISVRNTWLTQRDLHQQIGGIDRNRFELQRELEKVKHDAYELRERLAKTEGTLGEVRSLSASLTFMQGDAQVDALRGIAREIERRLRVQT